MPEQSFSTFKPSELLCHRGSCRRSCQREEALYVGASKIMFIESVLGKAFERLLYPNDAEMHETPGEAHEPRVGFGLER
jgi:hypothetical protein